MDNINLKKQVKDNILMFVADAVDKPTLQMIDTAIDAEFVKVEMREMTTLPAVVERTIDEQNKRIISLFMYKKADPIRWHLAGVPGRNTAAPDDGRQGPDGHGQHRHKLLPAAVRAWEQPEESGEHCK